VRAFFGCRGPVAAVDLLTRQQATALAELAVEHFMGGRSEHAREARRHAQAWRCCAGLKACRFAFTCEPHAAAAAVALASSRKASM